MHTLFVCMAFFYNQTKLLIMKTSIFFLLILVLSSCGGGDNPKDVIIKTLHTEQVCKESNYRYCFLAVDTAAVIQPIHKMDGLIFSFPKTSENEK